MKTLRPLSAKLAAASLATLLLGASTCLSQQRAPVASARAATENQSSSFDRFLATEVAVIRTRNVLEPASRALDLPNRWNVTKDDAVETLKKIVAPSNIPGTELIAIKVRHSSAEDARDIANAVANAYRNYRASLAKRQMKEAVAKLEKQIAMQAKLVEEKRNLLNEIVDAKAIRYTPQGNNPHSHDDTKASQIERVRIESQIATLQRYRADQLIEYAAAIDVPDNPVKKIKPEYDKTLVQLAALRASGLGEQDPKVVAQKKLVGECKTKIDAAIGKLVEGLKSRTSKLKNQGERNREELVKRSIATMDLRDASDEFERAKNQLDSMSEALISARINSDPERYAIIHERARVPKKPIPGTRPPLYEATAIIQVVPPAGVR